QMYIVGIGTVRASSPGTRRNIARYHPRPPDRAPSSTISLWKRSTISRVIPARRNAQSVRPPRRLSSSSGTYGRVKNSGDNALTPWLRVSTDRTYAPGCGTEIAVSVDTMSGRLPATHHATYAHQSWPTTRTGPSIG